jgi:rod shape-determining protein MreB
MIGNNVFGVDLGTSQIKIYSQKKNQTIIEKDMVAVMDGEQVLAVGNDAFEMFEKTPPNIRVIRPVTEGSISDIDKVEAVLHTLLRKMDRHIGHGPVIYFSAPSNRSEIEQRAYYAISMAGNLKNPRVFLVDRPICDAIALGIPLTKTHGTMIVNIGAQNTDISVIANEQVVISKSIPIGGEQMNEAICDIIRRKNNLLIGHRTARRLKAVLASFGREEKEARKIVGLNTLSGLPREGIVSSALVNDAVTSQMKLLAEEIRDFLERMPPQIEKCVEEEGIYLTGGTTRIPEIDRFFKDYAGCRINLSSYYDLCTIKGLEELITHKALHRWASPVRNKK